MGARFRGGTGDELASWTGHRLPSGSTLIQHPDPGAYAAPVLRSRVASLAALAFALLLPAGAEAACGVAAPRADYETPDVQVYVRKHDLVACHRATGKARVVGYRANDGMGTDEYTAVNGVVGGRWVWTSFLASFAESADVREDTLTDLRTGEKVKATISDEDTDGQVIALPGALVVAGPGGVAARLTDGRKLLLGPEPATALAASGARVYWRVEGAVRTTVLELPAADPAQRAPLARTIGRCRPKPGARLVIRDAGGHVVSRAAGATWACLPRRGSTRQVATGVVSELSLLSAREVVYARPGFAGVFDVATGTRRELESSAGPVAVTPVSLVVAGPGGLRSWGYRQKAPTVVSPEPATEVAIGDSELERVVYWLDAAATPRTTVIVR